MSGRVAIDIGAPSVLVFRGPDAERYLNGQLTQDVRRAGSGQTFPSCVTDAKGRLQFRVWIARDDEGAFLVQGEPGIADDLEARLTRYLIADDVDVSRPDPPFRMMHLTGDSPAPPERVVSLGCARFGGPGADWWIPDGFDIGIPDEWKLLAGDEFEAFRIRRGTPAWGRELFEGLLPPEAVLEASDISYQKGCYIGQEVISRMKRAGKTNKRLVHAVVDEAVPDDDLALAGPDGSDAGFLTSVSPLAHDGVFHVLGYVNRGATECFAAAPGGRRQPLRPL
ncbi:MAG: hypothetical protein H7A49_07680 [Akkermansiaceae bacterium]|nr:hypothetical protein [Akkermansiaceae bacterium]MCP5546558.1 hypothetical protein [Akkermansiaceae bacterium]